MTHKLCIFDIIVIWTLSVEVVEFTQLSDNQGYPYIWPSHYCKDSQITSLKLYLIVTHFVNFKNNFPKEKKFKNSKKN